MVKPSKSTLKPLVQKVKTDDKPAPKANNLTPLFACDSPSEDFLFAVFRITAAATP